MDDFDCGRAKGKLAARKSADPPSPSPAVTITVISTLKHVIQCNLVEHVAVLGDICSQMKRIGERSASDRMQWQHLRGDLSK